MAQQTLNAPASPYEGPNTRDPTPERGDGWKTFVDKCQAMFTELYNLLGSVTAAQIGYITGVTPGTNAANKAVVAGADGKVGALTFDGAVTQEVIGLTTANVGAAEAGAVAVENGDAIVHRTVLTLTAFAVGTSADNAALAIGALLYTFPAGVIMIDAIKVNAGLTLADAVQTNTPELGLGTTQAAGANATLGAAGATTENLFEGTATADVAGTPLVDTKQPTAAVPFIMETADAHTLYLNAAATWANLTAPAALTADGTITITWRHLAA